MKKIIIGIIVFFVIILAIILIINFLVIKSTKNRIKNEDDVKNLENIDCILVLGAATWEDKPSPMLEDRLLEAISLYKNGVASKIIMSGDHTKIDYDEVSVMKQFAIDKGVPSNDIFMDHAGISTYDSLYRAKEIFGINKIVIVTQKYHLYRALYIANSLGMEAYGVASDPRKYQAQIFREIREILARNKDMVKCIFKPQSKFLGDKISISGNGNITNE